MNQLRTILVTDDHSRSREVIRRFCLHPDDVVEIDSLSPLPGTGTATHHFPLISRLP